MAQPQRPYPPPPLSPRALLPDFLGEFYFLELQKNLIGGPTLPPPAPSYGRTSKEITVFAASLIYLHGLRHVGLVKVNKVLVLDVHGLGPLVGGLEEVTQ